MKRWVVLEHERQLDELSAPIIDATVLALSPGVVTACLERQIPVVGIERYFARADLDEVAVRNFGHVDTATAALSTAWATIAPPAAEGFDPFRAAAYILKRTADAVTFRLTELVAFLDAEHPDEVAVPALARTTSSGLLLHPEADLATDLLRRCDRTRIVELDRESPRPPTRRRMRAMVPGGLVNRNLLSFARFRWAEGLRSSRRGGKPRITVAGGDGEVRAFAAWAWRERGAAVDWWIHPNQPPARGWLRSARTRGGVEPSALQLSQLSSAVRSLGDLPIWMVGDQQAGREVLVERLNDYIDEIPRLLKLYTDATRYFETAGSRALVTGQSSTPEQLTISQAARAAGLPHVVFQHGGCYGYCRLPTLNWSDLSAASIFAAWGDGVVEDLKDQLGPDHARVHFVNSGWTPPLNGEAARPTPSAAPVLLYVTTGLHGNLRYGPDHSPSDNEYVDLQHRVVRSLLKADGGRVIVKLHYKDQSVNPLRRRLKDIGGERLEVRQTGSFVELLPRADVVIADYASTTMLQALAAGKPVVLVDQGVHRYSDNGLRALRAAVRWVDASAADWPERLVQQVRDAASGGTRAEAAAFLRSYGDPVFKPELVWQNIERWDV